MSTQNSSALDRNYPGVTIEYICDGQAFVATVANNSRQTIDQFVEAVQAEQQDWPPEKIGYMVADLSQTLGGFNTPYGRAKMNEMMVMRPNTPYYVAVITSNNMLLAMARVFLNNLPRKTIHSHICFTREEAIAWIEASIANNKRKE